MRKPTTLTAMKPRIQITMSRTLAEWERTLGQILRTKPKTTSAATQRAKTTLAHLGWYRPK
jgi:hypothetical protein